MFCIYFHPGRKNVNLGAHKSCQIEEYVIMMPQKKSYFDKEIKILWTEKLMMV